MQSNGWSFMVVLSGVAYWLQPRATQELVSGAALLASERATGIVRASQLGKVEIQYVRLQPNRLGGLVTWGEQQTLISAAAQESSSIRVFEPSAPVAVRSREIFSRLTPNTLPARLKLLELFIEAFGQEFWQSKNPMPITDARLRLIQLLNEIPALELLELSFGDLVERVRCTPRHLTRIFQDVVGMSFREKQAQLRLVRAQELLATTESKVVDVALESGYRSLSLFNLMFKRRFGTTPGKWRDRTGLKPPPLALTSRIRGG